MKRLMFGIVSLVFLALAMPVIAQEVSIYCNKDVYYSSPGGIIDVYCFIDNTKGSTKNEKVGVIFDDWLEQESYIMEMEYKEGKNWVSIKKNLDKIKPEKRTKHISQQNIQIKAGETKELHLKVKTPFGSSGKFDVDFGEWVLDPHWVSGWDYKQEVTISWNLSENVTDWPVNITLATDSLITAGKMKADCSDIRVTDANETDNDYDYFVRYCDTHDSEIWIMDNFTAGNDSRLYAIFYGNASADVVFVEPENLSMIWEDFNNASAFNQSDWTNHSVCQIPYLPGIPEFGVDNGNFFIHDGSCDGNNGIYAFKNSWPKFNLSLGFYVDFMHWYRHSGGVGEQMKQPVGFSNANDGFSNYDTDNYGYALHNTTHISKVYSSSDLRLRVWGARPSFEWLAYFVAVNESGASTQQWDRITWYYDTVTQNFTLFGNLSGTYEELILDVQSLQGNPYMLPYAFIRDNLTFSTNFVIGFSETGGGTQDINYSLHDWVFVRKWRANEPFVSDLSGEIPFESSDLILTFIDPTPNDTETVDADNISIRIESNKTLHHCELYLDDNFSGYGTLSNASLWCTFSTVNITATHTYYVFGHDIYDFNNVTENRTVTRYTPPAPPSLPLNVTILPDEFLAQNLVPNQDCIDNDTLRINYTIEFCQDNNCTIYSRIQYHNCVYGCDYVDRICKLPPYTEAGIGIALIFLVFLLTRWVWVKKTRRRR